MAIDQKPILFPGVLIGWDNYDEAYRYVNSLEYHGEGDPYRVIFFASEAQSLKFINTRYFSHRLAGYIYAQKQEGRAHTFKIASAPKADISTIEAWEESFEPNVW